MQIESLTQRSSVGGPVKNDIEPLGYAIISGSVRNKRYSTGTANPVLDLLSIVAFPELDVPKRLHDTRNLNGLIPFRSTLVTELSCP